MGVARIAVLALAAIAAVFVALYVRNSASDKPAEAATIVQQTEVVEMPTGRVLVARRDLGVGQRIAPEDLAWQPWPDTSISGNFFSHESAPAALEDFTGAVARVNVLQGEPITASKLVHPGDAGFMAAVLTPGMRAVSVPISAETGAGGFILPGDRVDIILAYEAEMPVGRNMRDVTLTNTVLRNVRVLAIDQTSATDDDDVVVGSTATLELTPSSAETVSLAVAMGDITLSLRSVTTATPGSLLNGGEYGDMAQLNPGLGRTMTIYRYGQSEPVMLRTER